MVMYLENFSKLYQSQQPLRHFVRFVTFAKFLGPFNQVNAIHSHYFANMLNEVFLIRFSLIKVKNDHRSKFSNLSNWKEEAWKNQGFNGIRTRDLRDTGAMLYQLSYEATHWERGQFIEFISPVRSEMMWSIYEIIHIFELRLWIKVKNDHRSKFSNLSNWKEEAWKNQGFNGIRTRSYLQISSNPSISSTQFRQICHFWTYLKFSALSLTNVPLIWFSWCFFQFLLRLIYYEQLHIVVVSLFPFHFWVILPILYVLITLLDFPLVTFPILISLKNLPDPVLICYFPKFQRCHASLLSLPYSVPVLLPPPLYSDSKHL